MSLSTYLQAAHARAVELALTLHSEEVTLEHLICALLSDEESAICELIEHAFADPETLYEDALALTPGILIVGSSATRPFSVRAVEVARRAVEGGHGLRELAVKTKSLEEVFFQLTK